MTELPAGFSAVAVPHKSGASLPAGFKVVHNPNEGASYNGTDPTNGYLDLAIPGKDTSQPGVTPKVVDESGWAPPGMLAPVQHNRKTGEWRPAVPQILSGVVQGATDAATLSGDVLAGKYDTELDPRMQFQNLSPELVGRGLNFTATTAGGGALPKVRTLGPVSAPGALGASRAADEFGIPLTKGQASGDLQSITKEETIRQGKGGASNIMRNFDAQQQEAIGGAAEAIGGGLGSRAESMPDMVTAAIQHKVALHKDAAAALYSIAEDGGVNIKPEMVQALPNIIDQSLKDAAVTVDPTLTPGAAVAMKLINEAGAMQGGLTPVAGAGAGSTAGADIAGVSLKGLEQVRKQIVGLGDGANGTDARAIKAIKKAYDDWTQTAVDNMLVSGDERALQALKDARSESGDYLRITSPNSGDTAGAAVKKMQAGDATAEEVGNWLYGADVVSPTLNAPKVAQRVKDIIGADSPEWNAVRASAWERLTKDMASGDPRSATVMAKRIETFLNAKGTTLSHVLYSDDERAQMQRFADALKATVTPRDATNPSRTAFTLTGAMNGITRVLSGVGVAAATGNALFGFAATAGIPVFKSIGARKAALAAVGQEAPGVPLSLTALGKNTPQGALRAGTDFVGTSIANENKASSGQIVTLGDYMKNKGPALGQLNA